MRKPFLLALSIKVALVKEVDQHSLDNSHIILCCSLIYQIIE